MSVGAWLDQQSRWLRDLLHLPFWASPLGWAEHVAAGWAFGRLLAPCGPFWSRVAVLGIAVVHEQAQGNFSDFRKANGGPLNGLVDVGTFLLGTLIP